MGELIQFKGAKSNKDRALAFINEIKESIETDKNNSLKGLIAILITKEGEGIGRETFFFGEEVDMIVKAVGHLEAAKMDLFLS